METDKGHAYAIRTEITTFCGYERLAVMRTITPSGLVLT